MSWSPYQRAILAELGHALYAPLPSPPASQQVVELPAGDSAMLARLAIAAGRALEELQASTEWLAISQTLRGDAAGKRALWPRLRAMRKRWD